jgi:hypothetical protein
MEGAHPGYDAPEKRAVNGIRTEVINSYAIPRSFYSDFRHSAAKKMHELGVVMWYSAQCRRMGGTKRKPMNVDKLVEEWATVVTGMAVAHDKDESDRYEAAIEKCLVPILTAPIKQVREFYPKLLVALKANPQVPFLVWRSYEIWIDQVLSKAPDEGIKALKTELAKEIADMVEQDVKDQIPEALIRALQWRNAETLAEVRDTVVKEKAKGNQVRLRGRESCLFLEVGGTEQEPKVCVQI